MRRWIFLGLMAGAAFWLAACANVEVDSSSDGDHALANAKTYYINADFPETDGYHAPEPGWQRQVMGAINHALTAKGYTAASNASEADFTLTGSWEEGKVLKSGKTVDTNPHASAGARNARYLTLNAVQDGDTQWSAQTPILTLPDDVNALLASFPQQGRR